MPTAYEPAAFWSTILTRTGSVVPHILPRAIGFLWIPVLLCTLQELHIHDIIQSDMDLRAWDGVVVFFNVTVAVITSFRLNDAYRKWNVATECMLNLHACSREVMAKLQSYCTKGKHDEGLRTARRLLVLICVLIKKHVRGEKSFGMELDVGLITEDENKRLHGKATYSPRDGKIDKFPSRNRPAFVFDELHRFTIQLCREGTIPTAPHAASLENSLIKMAEVNEEVELLGLTVLPLPYAQLSRMVCIIFLISVPLSCVGDVGWGCLPISFVANVIFFAMDEVSTKMETPFGDDEDDVDLEKMIRRIDKHTAAQLSLFSGTPEANFDLYPESRKTDSNGGKVSDRDQTPRLAGPGAPRLSRMGTTSFGNLGNLKRTATTDNLIGKRGTVRLKREKPFFSLGNLGLTASHTQRGNDMLESIQDKTAAVERIQEEMRKRRKATNSWELGKGLALEETPNAKERKAVVAMRAARAERSKEQEQLEREAATALQKTVRGHLTRLKRKRPERQVENAAATTLQGLQP